jgi:hypothetical protein
VSNETPTESIARSSPQSSAESPSQSLPESRPQAAARPPADSPEQPLPSASQPPEHLPTDPAAFFRAGADMELLTAVEATESKHVLEQLGPPPFRKTSFPMMGFLASFYEHVAAHVANKPPQE